MTLIAYFGGVVMLAATLLPVVWAAVRFRSRILPRWSGASARLAEMILTLFAIITACQILGSIGMFRRLPLLLSCAIGGLAVATVLGKPTVVREPARAARKDQLATPWMLLALAIVAVTVGAWTIPTIEAVRHGIADYDSLWYPLPRAARFVQDGWLTRLHFTGPETPEAFYSANGDVVHAIGMLFFGRDIVAPFLNLAWLLAAFLAAWCIGESGERRGPVAIVLSSLVITAPSFARDQGGSAEVDIAVTFFLLAAAALLLHPDSGRWGKVLAGLAAGSAVGTKLTILPAIAVLSLVLLIAREGRSRARWLFEWAIPVAAASGFWFARNLARTGSPLPNVKIGFGSFAFPRPSFRTVDEYGYSVATYLLDRRVWRAAIAPFFDAFFGDLWPLTIALAGLGIALTVIKGRTTMVRVLGGTALAALVAYVFTPTTAWGPRGQPEHMGENLAYVVPGMALALTLVALAVPMRTRRSSITWMLLLGVTFITAQTGRWGPWQLPSRRWGVAAILLFGLLVVIAASINRRDMKVRMLAVGVLGAFLLAGGYTTAHRYMTGRFAADPAARWADGVRNARIAEAGERRQYALYGDHLTNRVQYAGSWGRNGSFHPATNCTQWRMALRRGRFDFIVLYSERFEPVETWVDVDHRERVWTRSDPAATSILRYDDVEIFRFDPTVPDEGCRAS